MGGAVFVVVEGHLGLASRRPGDDHTQMVPRLAEAMIRMVLEREGKVNPGAPIAQLVAAANKFEGLTK